MNGVQTRFKCKLDVKRCKRFVFPPSSLLPRSNALKTKAIRYFQTDRTLTRIVSPPLIDSLLDDTHGMSNSEILNYQLDKFREVIEANKEKREQKIVFIHGKGDGVLRKAIIDELKRKHSNYRYQDASFQEYGFGATMVTIK